MKKLTIVIFNVFSLIIWAQQQESPQQLINLLRRSFTDQERLNVARRMVANPSAEYADVFTKTLADLASRRIETGSQQDQQIKQDLATILIQQLGVLRAKEAEPVLFNLSKELRIPVLRGEAFLSLGRVASEESVSYMNETLLQISDSSTRTREEEIVAYGIVRGLNEANNVKSFPALFIASRSWFSNASQVKQLAEQAWRKLGDTTELVSALAVSGEATRHKIIAVRFLIDNPGSNEVMSVKAVEILNHGLNLKAGSQFEVRQIDTFTREAARLAIRFSQANPDSVEPFRKLVELNRDPNEVSAVIDALARGRTDAGIAYLIQLLSIFNQRQAAGGNNDQALRQINQILTSFDVIADPRTRQVLLEFIGLNYTQSLRQRAQAIVNKMPQQ